MASTATSRLGLEKQGTGDNTATWGSELNTKTIDLIDEAIAGFESIAITGGVTLTSANYVSNQARKSALKFTGALAIPANIVVPSKSKIWVIWNASGAVLTIKTASGAGAAVANGDRQIIFCDGSDCYGLTRADMASVSYVNTAIASASVPASTGAVKISANDAGANYLIEAMVAGSGIVITENDDSGSETLSITSKAFEAQFTDAGSVGAETIDVDFSDDSVLEFEATGNFVLNFTNLPAAGTYKMKPLKIWNGGAYSPDYSAVAAWDGGSAPTLATGTSKYTKLAFEVDDGSNVVGSVCLAEVDLS